MEEIVVDKEEGTETCVNATDKTIRIESRAEESVTKASVDTKSNDIERNHKKSKKKSKKPTSNDEIKELEVSKIKTEDVTDQRDSAEKNQTVLKPDEIVPDLRNSCDDKVKDIVTPITKSLPLYSGNCIHDIPVKDPCNTCYDNIERLNVVRNTTLIINGESKNRAASSLNSENGKEIPEIRIQSNLDEKTGERQDTEKDECCKVEIEAEVKKEKDSTQDDEIEDSRSNHKNADNGLLSEKENHIFQNREISNETRGTVKSDIVEIHSSPLKSEGAVMHKPPVQQTDKKQRRGRSRSSDKEKKKNQAFSNQELEALRSNFAKTQGVKEVLVEPFKPLSTDERIKEDIDLPFKIDTEKETDILVGEASEKPGKNMRKTAEESLYEPVGAEREEFVKKKLSQSSKDIGDVKPTDENIIGFDLKCKDERKANEESVRKDDEQAPPKIPERRKNSSRHSLNVSIVEHDKSEKKEKKSSFIKEWQKDLREFFSLRKKKPSTGSGGGSVQDDQSMDDGKISVDNESLYLPSNQQIEEETPLVEECEDKNASNSTETPVEKRIKKRKNRRKTNSEIFETNPFKVSEENKGEKEIEHSDEKLETDNPDDKNLSQKPKVVVPSPLGSALII